MSRFFLKVALLICLSCMIYSGNELFAQRRSATLIGTVDFRALLLLHPTMMDYSPEKQAFKVDVSQSPDRQNEAKSIEHQKHIEDLRSRSIRLQAQITEQHRNHEKEMTKLSGNYLDRIKDNIATAAAAVESERYNRSRTAKETSYRAQLRSLGDQLANVSKELQQLERISYHEGYTTPEETKKYFRAILAEVKQYVQHIASQRGMGIVLNNSYQRTLRRTGSEGNPMAINSDNEYRNIFRLPLQTAEGGSGHQLHSGYQQTVADMTKNWLDLTDTVLMPFTDTIIDADIIVGGTDITSDVLTAIFRQYRLNENIGVAVIRAATSN